MRWLDLAVGYGSVLAVFGSTLAQSSASDLSPCATSCVVEALPFSGCAATNVACLCSSVPFTAEIAKCLQANCTVRESLALGRYQHSSCGTPVRSQVRTTRRVIWTMFTISTTSVLGRFLFRHPLMKGTGYGWDDFFILVAYVILIPFTVEVEKMSAQGLGKDLWTLEPDQITATLYHFWVEALLYNFVMTFTKISIILLYLRVWTSDNTWTGRFRMACFILIAVHIAYAFAIAFTVAFECSPVSLAWTRWDGEHHGHCIGYQAQSYAISVLNIILDFATFLLPIPKLLKLNISNRKKAVVCITFLVGFLATLFSIIRLGFLAKYGLSNNFTFYFAAIAICTALETNLAVICACFPSMAGLLQKAWGKAFESWKTSTSSHHSRVLRRVHLSTLDSFHTAREPEQFELESPTWQIHEMPKTASERLQEVKHELSHQRKKSIEAAKAMGESIGHGKQKSVEWMSGHHQRWMHSPSHSVDHKKKTDLCGQCGQRNDGSARPATIPD